MNSNRTSSFPAATTTIDPETLPIEPHRPNNGYLHAKILGVMASIVAVLAFGLASTGHPTAGRLVGGLALFQTLMFVVSLSLARRKTNRRVAAYHDDNPDVELLHGP